MPVSLLLHAVTHCLRTLSLVAFDLARLAFLSVRSHKSLAAENLFLRKQLALFQERKVKLSLSRFLRQTVKTQNPSNGELSHGIVS